MEIESPLLKDIVIIFAMSALVLMIGHRFRVPAIVGFLLTGIIAGPHALNFVQSSEVENLSRIGIVLLLFTIGLEFSLKKILELKYYFLVGGILQVGLTVAAGFGVAYVIGRPLGESILLGFLLSMSSTAIVLKILESKDEADTPFGQLIIGILIFQDIIAVPMMIFVPFLGNQKPMDQTLLYHFAIGFTVLCIVFFGAIKLVPRILYTISKARSKELFLITILTICSTIAWLASSAGLSLSLGAFLAGLLIAESEYSREALSNVIPLRDIFASFFFVSMGMLLDISFVLQYPLLILAMAMLIIVLKAIIVAFTTFALGLPIRIIILSGIALAQIGEFSFVLAHCGIECGLSSDFYYQLFLSVAILTMALTPPMMSLGHWLAMKIANLDLPERLKHGRVQFDGKNSGKKSFSRHIVIIGFGVSGQNMAKTAKSAQIPYVIIETNPKTVAKEQENGEPIIYGDACHDDVLKHANISEAKAIAVVVNDRYAAKYIVQLCRQSNPRAYLIVRTRYINEAIFMKQLGADEVIADEYGTSIEIFTHVLQKFDLVPDEIKKHAESIRAEGLVFQQ